MLIGNYGFLNPNHPRIVGPWPRLLLGFAAIALSFGVAWLSFNFYERRFLTLKDRFNAITKQHPAHPDFPERDRITV